MLLGIIMIQSMLIGICTTELKSLGAEVVKADIGDVESLKKAFEGAYGVFGLTGMSYSVAVLISV